MVSKLVWRIGWTFIKALKSLKICTFMGSFCPKRNVSAKKFQRNYVSWYWKVTQNLKENWLMVWKMTWGIWLIFMQAAESLQISAKKVQKSYLSWHWRLIQTLKKNFFCLKYDMRKFVNFKLSSGKSENFHFDGIFL